MTRIARRAATALVALAMGATTAPTASAVPAHAADAARPATTAVASSPTPARAAPAGHATPTQPATDRASRAADADGPHSPAGRKPAAPTVTRVPGARVLDVDVGDVELGRRTGRFRAPMRGLLVVPERGRRAPLVVVSHLRMPGCTKDVLAYPCPRGTKELHLDRGMTYLGVDLARRGYAVLIPDLSPLWIGASTSAPYDQIAGWRRIVGGLRERVAAADRGRAGFGMSLAGRVDTSRSALVVHSRSSYIVEPAVRAWRRTSPVASVFAYGPAATADDPAPPDIPYLVALGGADGDVQSTPVQWVSAHLGVRRRSMLAVATVPGLGHSYVNRALSAARIDDRMSCDASCPTAAAHEAFLSAAASSWLAATYPPRGARARPGDLPLRPTSTLPASLGGRPVPWLAVTNSARVAVAYDGSSRTRGVRTIGGGSMRACRYREAMDPTMGPDRCRDARIGVVNSVARVLQVRLTPTGGVALATRPVRGVREVVLTVNPTGSRADRRPGTPLRVTVRDATGRRQRIDVAPLSEALRDRRTASQNGDYLPTTLRLPVGLRGAVVGVDLTGGTGSGALDVQRVELVSG